MPRENDCQQKKKSVKTSQEALMMKRKSHDYRRILIKQNVSVLLLWHETNVFQLTNILFDEYFTNSSAIAIPDTSLEKDCFLSNDNVFCFSSSIFLP